MSSYRDVAYMGDFANEDFIDTGFDSDMGTEAEFEWNTWNDAYAWESWSASENFPPDSARALPAESVKDVVYYGDDSKCLESDVLVRQSTWKFWPSLELNDKVFFSFDYSSIGSQ